MHQPAFLQVSEAARPVTCLRDGKVFNDARTCASADKGQVDSPGPAQQLPELFLFWEPSAVLELNTTQHFSKMNSWNRCLEQTPQRQYEVFVVQSVSERMSLAQSQYDNERLEPNAELE